jgi:hypothetical protein
MSRRANIFPSDFSNAFGKGDFLQPDLRILPSDVGPAPHAQRSDDRWPRRHPNVVADGVGTAAAGGHRADIEIGQLYLPVRGAKHLHLETLETPHLLLQRLDLLFQAALLDLQRL